MRHTGFVYFLVFQKLWSVVPAVSSTDNFVHHERTLGVSINDHAQALLVPIYAKKIVFDQYLQTDSDIFRMGHISSPGQGPDYLLLLERRASNPKSGSRGRFFTSNEK